MHFLQGSTHDVTIIIGNIRTIIAIIILSEILPSTEIMTDKCEFVCRPI